jgi:hypothetical protein
MIWRLQPVGSSSSILSTLLHLLLCLLANGQQSWHSAVQHRYLHVYKVSPLSSVTLTPLSFCLQWFTLIIIGIMLYVFFLEPLKDFLMAFFFSGTPSSLLNPTLVDISLQR